MHKRHNLGHKEMEENGMFIKKNSVVTIDGGKETFFVLDIKKIAGKEVVLLQGVSDGVLRFALENIDAKKLEAKLLFVNDFQMVKEIAQEFDKQDGKVSSAKKRK